MSKLTIHTNNVPRDVIHAWELTPEERAEFDYLSWEAIERGEDSREFVRYKGQLLDLGDFVATAPGPWNYGLPEAFGRWDGYASDTYFSALLIRYARDECGRPDWERVVIGWYCS